MRVRPCWHTSRLFGYLALIGKIGCGFGCTCILELLWESFSRNK
ncbi:hypothetical protein PORCRE_96 [Porphyromonas crevioricanis JCM 15906]|uniref:Uncharacterized protein n=1 Tax=Porphyromonas crevioricanis JCM 15906 TaxID=1305617 RepID=S4NFQ9_9PORP|nr:hypothetical protein PORCRE_96 [Porphyromonas crevioricanis JCM 15906]